MSKVMTTVIVALAVFAAFHLIGDQLAHSFNPISTALSQAQQ